MKSTPATPPDFDPAKAKPVPPARHEPTGRTYAFVQDGHLFSATGVHIAPADEKPAFRPLPADL